MKKLFILLFFSICTTFVVAQNVNHSQTLFDMLMRDECFKSWEYMHQYKDSIAPEVKLLYEHKNHGFFNRLDSSAFYYEKMIDECPMFFPDENTKLGGINVLIDLYSKAGTLEKVLEICQRVKDIIQNPPFNQDKDWQKQQLFNLSKLEKDVKEEMQIPKPCVVKDRNDANTIDIQKEGLLTASIKCNGVSVNAHIDTGPEFHLFISKAFAEKCKISKIISTTDSLELNGVLARIDVALVDSIRIGSVLFENIPAHVIHDNYLSLYPDSITLNSQQMAKYDSVFSKINFVIGLPMLKMLGSLELDWEKDKMCVEVKDEILQEDNKPNMFIANNHLYAHLLVNASDFIGYVDMGYAISAISLSSQFYETHRKEILLSPEIKGKEQRAYGITLLAPQATYQSVLNPMVLLNSKQIPLREEEDVLVWLGTSILKNGQGKDGMIGLPFLKKLGKKVRFDFVNMRITVE